MCACVCVCVAVAPLYNRFLFYAQRSRGNDGVSQKNTGMWASAFFALAKVRR